MAIIMKIRKKQLIAAALVLSLGAAVYLNWSLTSPKTVSKMLGETKFVNATVSTTATPDETKEVVAVKNLSEKQEKYFASAKTERDKIQDKIIDEANEMLGVDDTPDENKSEAQNMAAAMIKNFTLQNTIESTLKAKGFSQCLCYINEGGCTVTVPKSDMKKNGRVVIKAAVTSTAGIPFDKITVVTV